MVLVRRENRSLRTKPDFIVFCGPSSRELEKGAKGETFFLLFEIAHPPTPISFSKRKQRREYDNQTLYSKHCQSISE